MRIIQVLNHLIYGDGVTNTALFINHVLDSAGIPHRIMTSYKDERIDWDEEILVMKSVTENAIDENDIVLYHFLGGLGLNRDMENLDRKKILVFHNVTVPDFFRDVDASVYQNCLIGHDDIKYTASRYLRAIVLSDFSRRTLVAGGWKNGDIDTLPLHEVMNSTTSVDDSIISKMGSREWTNILFTGRISPNKKFEDIIRIFEYYQKTRNVKSRLILIGSSQFPSYREALEEYIRSNEIVNVIFTGHITDAERNAYYAAADVFLCMSEHEGFCIPLLEAFQRKIPVIAYRAAAVPDTMGNAGVLVDTKDPETVSREIERLINDKNYRNCIVQGQLERLKVMTLSSHKEEFLNCLKKVYSMNEWKYSKDMATWLPIPPPSPILPPKLEFVGFDKLVNCGGIVLYGIGKTGQFLLRNLPSDIAKKIVAICDNGYKEGTYMHKNVPIPVYPQEMCIDRVSSDAMYLITVQKGYLKILRGLLDCSIPFERILFYDNARKRIESMQ